MARKTDGEKAAIRFQTNRFIQQNGEWFYMTRDGQERGPFEDKEDAAGDLILYLRECYNKDNMPGE